jgi:hypothetical protein
VDRFAQVQDFFGKICGEKRDLDSNHVFWIGLKFRGEAGEPKTQGASLWTGLPILSRGT